MRQTTNLPIVRPRASNSSHGSDLSQIFLATPGTIGTGNHSCRAPRLSIGDRRTQRAEVCRGDHADSNGATRIGSGFFLPCVTACTVRRRLD